MTVGVAVDVAVGDAVGIAVESVTGVQAIRYMSKNSVPFIPASSTFVHATRYLP